MSKSIGQDVPAAPDRVGKGRNRKPKAPSALLVALASVAILVCTLLDASPAFAHEFWIEPLDYAIQPGERLVADVRVGENFRGNAFSFNPARHRRSAIVTSEGEEVVASRIGDRPAVNQRIEEPGTAIVVHETEDSTLTYDSAETFANFVAYEGLGGVLERHRERGLPDTGFTEIYSRSVKSLVRVGDGPIEDRALGLPVEIVVEGDPRDAAERGEPLTITAYDGTAPRAGALVNVFSKPARGEGETTLEPMRLDENGRLELSVEPSRHYLLNTVVMREREPETGAAWESLWGSITFSTAE